MAAKAAPAKAPAKTKTKARPLAPKPEPEVATKVRAPEPYDWLASLLFAEKNGTISDEGKDTLKRVRAKAKDSDADATTLRAAEENAAAY